MGDTEDLQRLINQAARGERDRRIQLEPRDYHLTPGVGGAWNLYVPPNDRGITIAGVEATIGASPTRLIQLTGAPRNMRLFHVDGADTRTESLTLESDVQLDADEHRAGIFIAAGGFTAHDVTARHFTGDGFYLYRSANRAALTECMASDNGRNGVTVGAGISDLLLKGTTCVRNGAQQFDHEAPRDARPCRINIIGCLFDSDGASGDYALTLGGSHPDNSGRIINVIDTDIMGPVYIVWADRVRLSETRIRTIGTKPAVSIWRGCSGIDIDDCDIHAEVGSGVLVAATGPGESSTPSDVRIRRTTIGCASPTAIGMAISGALSTEVSDCAVIGGATLTARDYAAGVMIRSVFPDQPMQRVLLHRNEIDGWGRCAVTVGGNTVVGADGVRRTSHIDHVELCRNRIGMASNTITDGVIMDDGSSVIRRLVTDRNEFGVGVERHLQRMPSVWVRLPEV